MVLSLHPVSPLSVYVHGHRRACVCEFADILNLFMGIMIGDWMCICYLTCIEIGFWRISLLCWFVSVWKNGWINSVKLISICCFIVSIYRKFVSKWLMHDWKWNWLWMCLKIHVVYDSDLPSSFFFHYFTCFLYEENETRILIFLEFANIFISLMAFIGSGFMEGKWMCIVLFVSIFALKLDIGGSFWFVWSYGVTKNRGIKPWDFETDASLAVLLIWSIVVLC